MVLHNNHISTVNITNDSYSFKEIQEKKGETMINSNQEEVLINKQVSVGDEYEDLSRILVDSLDNQFIQITWGSEYETSDTSKDKSTPIKTKPQSELVH